MSPSQSVAALTKQMLISSFEELEVASLITPGTQSSSPKRIRLEDDDDAGKQGSILWGFFNKLVEEQRESEISPRSALSVINSYLRESNEPRNSNPL